jgi:hypothetical protein
MTFHFRTSAVAECESMSAGRQGIRIDFASLKYFCVEWLSPLEN